MDSTTEEASPCVEPGFDGLPYPGFWEQVTLRSMAIAVVLAAIFSLVTLRIYMTIGVVGALNMPTNVLSFFSVKSLVSLQRRYDIASAPFTRQENIFLQTCVITCVNSAISGGLPNYIIAMNAQVAKSLRDDPDKSDIIDRIPTGKYALFLFLTGLVAITLMLPLAQVMIVDYRLLFPTGSVVAHLINSFHTQQGACAAKLQVAAIFKTFVGSFSWSMFQWFFAGGDNCGFQAFPVFGLELYKRNRFYFDFSASFVGLGMIVPHVVNIGLLFGAITSWGLLYPFLQSKRGQWYHTDSPTSLNGMNGYKIDNNQPRIKEGAESYPVTLEKQGDKFGSGFVLEDQRKDTVVVPVPSDSQFIVGTDGPFLMEKSNWPNLKITEVQHEESPMESLTQENVFSPECGLNNESFVEHKSPQAIRKGGGEMEGEDLMDVISCQSKDSDLEENSQGWQPSKSKKPKKHMKNRVVVASRTSSRISRDGIPIAEKASRRAMERNNISGFAWAIWINRNRMAIQHEFPKYPSDIIYSAVTFMQKWSILLKEDDWARVKQVKDDIMLWIGDFKPTVFSSTDVVEI